MLKQRLDAVFATLPAEKREWEGRRQRMRDGFLRELEVGAAAAAGDKGTTAPGPAGNVVADEKRKEVLAAGFTGRGSSDEDAVIVEKGGDNTGASAASSNVGAGGGGGGKSKKKKGKK